MAFDNLTGRIRSVTLKCFLTLSASKSVTERKTVCPKFDNQPRGIFPDRSSGAVIILGVRSPRGLKRGQMTALALELGRTTE